jgi:plasmid stabilization system protein ParE
VPLGIARDRLRETARDALDRLIRHYLDRSPEAVAHRAWERLAGAGLDTVSFAWAGSDRPGQGHYYSIQGPTLLIEYDNTQNDANHIHSVWRDPANDWGDDVLAEHYREAHTP